MSTHFHRRTLLSRGIALTAGVMAPSFANADSNRYGIEGRMAPPLQVDYWIDRDGNPASFDLAAQRGKWVMLKCFQDWCPGCHSSGFPTLQAFSAAFADHPKVAIAGIQTVFEGFSTNTVEDVRKNQLRYDLPIIMGHDPGDPQGDHRPATMRDYRTGGTPWIIMVNPEGRVVYNYFHINAGKLIQYIRSEVG